MTNWMKIGTIALIIVFGIEIIAFLFTQNPYSQDGLPTDAPIPSINTAAFEGINVSEGYVISVGKEILVVCNTTANVGPLLNNISGVSLASVDVANGRIGVDVIQNASTEKVGNEVKKALLDYCTPYVYKRAYINLPEVLNFTAQSGESKLLSSANYQCLSSTQSFFQCFAFVQLGTSENKTTRFATYIRLSGDTASFITSEEQPYTLPMVFKSAKGDAKILDILNDASASVTIPWKDRLTINETIIATSLNASLNASNVKLTAEDSITLNLTGNETLELAKNLSFVLSAVHFQDTIVLQVEKNFTDTAFAQAELSNIGVAKSDMIFPSAEISFDYTYNDGSRSEISTYFEPNTARFARRVIVSLVNQSAVESDLGGTLPEDRYDLFAQDPSQGSQIKVIISAIMQGDVVNYAQAFEDREAP